MTRWWMKVQIAAVLTWRLFADAVVATWKGR
jgi:hypothetical protein